jgi:hypothetical protein
MKKLFSAFICVLLISGLLFTSISCIVEVQAEVTITKLSTPKLVSVTYEDHSYDVPASTTTDPFTGNPVETPGYYVYDRTLTMVIDKKNINLEEPGYFYHIIRMKGSYSNEWDSRTVRVAPYSISTAPNSQLVTLVFTSKGSSSLYCGDGCLELPLEGQADFQVQIIKQENVYYPPTDGWPSSWIETLTAESDWSNTQTVTIARDNNEVPNQTEPTPSPTYASDQNETQTDLMTIQLPLIGFLLVLILCPVIIVVLIIALIHTRKTTRHKQTTQT